MDHVKLQLTNIPNNVKKIFSSDAPFAYDESTELQKLFISYLDEHPDFMWNYADVCDTDGNIVAKAVIVFEEAHNGTHT